MAKFSEWIGKGIQRVFGLTDEQPLIEIFGNETYAGKTVTPSKALQISTVWACIRLLSETLGQFPIFIVRKVTGPNGTQRIRLDNHDLMPILTIRANRRLTPQEFMESMMLNLLTWGNAFAEIDRNRATGDIIGLNPLLASQVDVKQQDDGRIEYHYHTKSGVLIFAADQILHIKLFGWTGLVGLSPIAHAAQGMGLSLATEEFGARFFGSGARPSGFLMTDRTLTPEQRVNYKQNFETLHEGLERSHKLALLEAGFKYQAITIPPNEAQFLQTRAFQVPEMCRWYLVPPHKIMHLEDANFRSAEQQDLEFYKSTVAPYATRFEQRFRLSLLPPEERMDTRIKFNMLQLLRTDALTTAKVAVAEVQNGLATRNEVRGHQDRNPIEGADELTVQKQMVELEDLDKVNDTQQGSKGVLPPGQPSKGTREMVN